MLGSESVCLGITERKQAQYALRRDEWNAEPRTEVPVAFELVPALLVGSVWDEQTPLGKENVQDGSVIGDVPCQWRLASRMRVSGGMEFSCKEEAVGSLGKQNLGGVTGHKIEQRCKKGVEDVVHAEILGEGQSAFAQGVRLGPSGFSKPKIQGHLLLGRLSGSDVAQGHEVAAGQVIGLDAVLDQDRSPVLAKYLHLAVALFFTQEIVFHGLQLERRELEVANRLPDELIPAGAENSEGCGVCFDTNSSLIQNQQCVEGAVEDRLKLVLGDREGVGRFAVLALGKNQEPDVKRNR